MPKRKNDRMRTARLGLLLAAGLLLGCPFQPERAIDEDDTAEARTLEVGETVVYDFAADSGWHRSPYLALHGQKLSFKPVGRAQGLSPQALRYRYAKLAYLLVPDQVLQVTNPGRIEFRVDPRYQFGFGGTVSVQIKRVE